jgi:hypothetical protein
MNAIGADFPLYRRQLIFVKTAFLLAAAMSTVSFLRVTALFPYFVKNGMSLEQARERFRTIDLSQYQKIGVTSSMWVLSENYDHTFLVPYQLPVVVSGARYPIIIQQNYWQSTVAPPVEGYAIAHDFFSPDVPRLFGVKLASTMPGYAFAVYLPNQFDNTTGQAGRSSVSATDSEPWHQAK